MSARKIKKSYRSCVGYFKSYKNDKQIAFESILERDFFTILEFDRDVEVYEEQPLTIKYELNGMRTRYTPDALVTYNDGSQRVFEVKYQNDIDTDEQLSNKLDIVSEEILHQTGHNFEVFTDESFNDIYLKNCIFLYSYAFLQRNDGYEERIYTALTRYKDTVSVKELLNMISMDMHEKLRLQPYLWYAVLKNTKLIDMSKKITMSSIIDPKEW